MFYPVIRFSLTSACGRSGELRVCFAQTPDFINQESSEASLMCSGHLYMSTIERVGEENNMGHRFCADESSYASGIMKCAWKWIRNRNKYLHALLTQYEC